MGYVITCTMSGNPIQSWILDSTLSIPNSGYWIPDSLSAEIVFWIPVVSAILDFFSWITDFKTEDSGLRIPQANISCDFGFCKQRSAGLRNPLAKISRIVESRLPYMGRYNDMAGIFVCLFVLSERDRRPIWEGSIPGRGFPEVISPSQVRPYGQ